MRSRVGPRSKVAPAGSPAGSWEHFPHGADVGVRGRGPSKAVAFEQAALAMIAIATNPTAIRPTDCVRVTCTAPDDELLLADWLNAILYEMATHRMVFGRFGVAIDGPVLRAELWGEPFDRARHEVGTEVKGATLTALLVGQGRDGQWTAQCVVDV